MPQHLAYKVIGYPHLSMRLALGKVYTRAELETRCGNRDPKRRELLHRKLEDPTLFKPVCLKNAVSRLVKQKGKAQKEQKEQKETNGATEESAGGSSSSAASDEPETPHWARPPVICPLEGEKQEVTRRRRIANSVAKSLLEEAHEQNRPVGDQDVLTALRVWGFLKNEQRTNVLPKGRTWVHSDTLGLLRTRSQRTCIAAASRAHPHFTRLLVRWLRNHWPADVPEDWPFTSISVNKGYAARRHRDRTNVGPSILKAFGCFKGGRVRYWPKDDLRDDVSDLKAEDSVLLDARTDPVPFDGTRAHEVAPFTGERYSLVFFPVNRYNDANEDAQTYLVNEGFNLPDKLSLRKARRALDSAP
eukprot:TRINITY_DN29435_c0_g1_i1.p1 TRINITY_DN29435_c0_g1~~TRINITY_DN29435_c0_g1_i1.p1  ORF type:complete len:360 (+),score=55.90 TRINITY_DN29435_c0_g1_i1:95-1174(+)